MKEQSALTRSHRDTITIAGSSNIRNTDILRQIVDSRAKDEERILQKYKNYGGEIERVRGTVHRPERQKQIENDSNSLQSYSRDIIQSLEIFIKSLSPDQQMKLEEELRILLEKNNPGQNSSQIRQNVVAGRHNLFPSQTSRDRDQNEQRYASEMVSKRLTLIQELRNLAMRYMPAELSDNQVLSTQDGRSGTAQSSGLTIERINMPDPRGAQLEQLDQREQKMDQREQQLDQREQQLDQREQKMDQREQQLDQHIELLGNQMHQQLDQHIELLNNQMRQQMDQLDSQMHQRYEQLHNQLKQLKKHLGQYPGERDPFGY